MSAEPTLGRIREVIDADQAPLSPAALRMADAIRDRHGDAVVALVFYGSALRDSDDPGKMLDFYVIVKSYRAVYPNPFLRLATAALPPGVHFLEVEAGDGRVLQSKYAIVSEEAFHHRAGGGVMESMLWARFVQPAVVVADDPESQGAIKDTFARACLHFYRQTAPLVPSPSGPHDVWVQGLAESYKTELRPEAPEARAQDIVARFPDRYAKLTAILQAHAPEIAPFTDKDLRQCRRRWRLRRVLGKPRGAARVIKGALTFDGGMDYILKKVADHSGVHLEVSDNARRHPILYAPVVAWRLYRAGAFR